MYKVRCKPWADLATALAVIFTLISGFGVFDFIDDHLAFTDPRAIPDYILVLIHLLLIALAIFLQLRGRESYTWAVRDEAMNRFFTHGVLAAVLFALPIPMSVAIHLAVHVLFKKRRDASAEGGDSPWYAQEDMSPRTARDFYAELLRNFAAGVIDVEDFEDADDAIRSKADPSVARLLDDAHRLAWSHYDDVATDRLRGRWKLSKEDRVVFARMIMFLKTDQPYQWTERQLDGLDAAAPRCVWPFVDVDDYRIALRHPRLLAGSRAQQSPEVCVVPGILKRPI